MKRGEHVGEPPLNLSPDLAELKVAGKNLPSVNAVWLRRRLESSANVAFCSQVDHSAVLVKLCSVYLMIVNTDHFRGSLYI